MVANVTPPLIVIVGPTASGKSALALEIAKQYGGEIICADSRTIYKGMDIGTGKPTQTEQKEVTHHLIDVVYPDQTFTVVDFTRLARRTIDVIWKRGNWPILVGGSGLFIDAIIFNYAFGSKPSDHERSDLAQLSVEQLQTKLLKQHIPLPKNSKNKRHLIRAIELKGLLQQERSLRSNTIVVGLTIKKETLEASIESRAYNMLKSGVLDEVNVLVKKYGWDSEPMKSNIYRALKPVTEGRPVDHEIINAIKKADQRLVKKQLTWFKRNQHIQWGATSDLKRQIAKFIKKHSR